MPYRYDEGTESKERSGPDALDGVKALASEILGTRRTDAIDDAGTVRDVQLATVIRHFEGSRTFDSKRLDAMTDSQVGDYFAALCDAMRVERAQKQARYDATAVALGRLNATIMDIPKFEAQERAAQKIDFDQLRADSIRRANGEDITERAQAAREKLASDARRRVWGITDEHIAAVKTDSATTLSECFQAADAAWDALVSAARESK